MKRGDSLQESVNSHGKVEVSREKKAGCVCAFLLSRASLCVCVCVCVRECVQRRRGLSDYVSLTRLPRRTIGHFCCSRVSNERLLWESEYPAGVGTTVFFLSLFLWCGCGCQLQFFLKILDVQHVHLLSDINIAPAIRRKLSDCVSYPMNLGCWE